MFKRSVGILWFVMLSASFSVAQKTTIYTHEDADFKTGIELFQKQKFGAAQKAFNKVVESHDIHSLVRADAEYYAAISGIELFNNDAEFLLRNFIATHPENPKAKTAYFYLGKFNYRKKDYNEAIKWFEKVDVYDLSKEELSEFYFKRGYSYFQKEKFEKAKKDFYEIKDANGKYSGPAKYYYSHISYNEKNYETALQGFLALKDDETFAPLVPYYIVQIYYLQKKYSEVIAAAPALVDSSNNKRIPEMARMIGDSYYRIGKYKEAISFLRIYETRTATVTQEDMYTMGFSYYKTGDCPNAIYYFKRATNNDDSLAQNAFYHLADCYVKTNDKQGARNAFASASRLNFDKKIQEDALFSYAKLSYELAYNPFGDAIDAFNKYIKTYPSSPRVDEAYGYLVNVYLTTKSYKEALQSIESIKSINETLKPTYQKIAYYRGVELFNNIEFEEAIKHFDKALIYKLDKTINALSNYWKGEAYYRMKQYANANEAYMNFMNEPGAFNLPEFNNAHYNFGYSCFHLKDFSSAGIAFRKFVMGKNEKPRKLNDAYNRIGDSYFMLRDYSGASENYAIAMKYKIIDADYSIYQHALANGLLKNYEVKINDLQQLLNNYPKSVYITPGRYELARTYILVNRPNDAITYFEKVKNENPNSSYYNKSMLQLGLIYFNKNEDEAALGYFDKVVKKDRKSPEANEALSFIKKIYADKGDTEGLEKYFKSVAATLPSGYLDTTAFEIGRKQYLNRECDNAIGSFTKYIEKYPTGIFITEANFYKAECEFKKGNQDAALSNYNFVIEKNVPEYLEASLVNASTIYFKKKDYKQALTKYLQLEVVAENPKNILDARIGVMRSAFYQGSHQQAIDYAIKVLSAEKVSNEIVQEARLITGKSYLATSQNDFALAEFRILANLTKNEKGAEAKYNVAYLLHKKADYKSAEKTLFELINESSYSYWIAKALLLLADNYVALNDVFQAKHTLNSIIESSDVPELVKEAQQKLDEIKAKENAKLQKSVSDTTNIFEIKENRDE